MDHSLSFYLLDKFYEFIGQQLFNPSWLKTVKHNSTQVKIYCVGCSALHYPNFLRGTQFFMLSLCTSNEVGSPGQKLANYHPWAKPSILPVS